jgi:hypothetical protein
VRGNRYEARELRRTESVTEGSVAAPSAGVLIWLVGGVRNVSYTPPIILDRGTLLEVISDWAMRAGTRRTAPAMALGKFVGRLNEGAFFFSRAE